MSTAKADSVDRIQKLSERCEPAKTTDELKSCVAELIEFASQEVIARDKLQQSIEFCASQTLYVVMKACLMALGAPPASAAAAPPSPPPPPTPVVRGWEKLESASRMDGSPSVILVLDSDDEVPAGYGVMTRPSLLIRCRENVTSLYISANWFLSDNVPVTYRLDKEKPVSQSWPGSTDRKAVGLWSGDRAIPFIKSLLGRETLLVRVTPFREAPKEMAFNIVGTETAIEPLRKACKW